jgi:hypothetical protein
MNTRVRPALLFAVALLFATSVYAKKLPNVDAFGLQKGKGNNAADLARKGKDLVRKGAPIQVEPRLGVPTFLTLRSEHPQLSGGVVGNSGERREVAAARAHLGTVSSLYGMSHDDIGEVIPVALMNSGKGPVVVKFRQEIDGVEVFREELNLVMNQKLEAVAVSGYLAPQSTPLANPGQNSWTRQPARVGMDALDDATDVNLAAATLNKSFDRDGYEYYTLASPVAGLTLLEPVRVKKVWFRMPDGIVPAYYVEVLTTNVTGAPMLDSEIDESAYAYVLSAADGSILFRKNLISEAALEAPKADALPPGGFSYRVWADPVTGIPFDTPAGNAVHPKVVPLPDGAQHSFVPMQDVTLPNFPFSMNDPWLAPGATETDGNNVDAFLNWYSPDGLGTPITTTPVDPPNGDHRGQITAAGQFLYTHQPDVDGSSVAARSASIVQMFYNINFLHDWFYDSGFNESARNAQKNNFGRGGLQGDDIRAQAQDFQSFSNANMLTPADGSRPRMRMYNFPNPANTLSVSAPAAIAGNLRIGVSQTGTRAFDVTGNIVIATFTAGPTTCTITNAAALAGNIAMFDFDNTDGTGCSFSTRIARIHATGATAALMVYTSAPANANLVANVTGINSAHTKPIAVVSWNAAAPIKTQLAVPATVTARLLRMADRDGTLDNQIMFHEWGHYISNRLIANAAGLNNNQGGAMGEGWGDFTAMLLTVRESDTLTPSNANWGGAYAIATYATSGVPYNGVLNHGYYLGIRRTPYSTDMTNYNALTFRHIMDGQALPSGPPIASSASPNSQVHNSGEVWATMLWECYAALLRDTLGASPRLTFQQAQDRMKLYFVTSLALTPQSPTYLEARDAVLAAAYATDITDYILFWQAFAKRGAGIYAVAPDRFSVNHAGVVESFDVEPEISFVSTTLDDSVISCDNDGILDGGETGKLTVTIKNVGTSPLTATVATISSATPGVTFPAGTTINFPPSDPYATVNGSVTVSYAAGIAGIQQIDFSISVVDPDLDAPRVNAPGFRANVTSIPAASATETVEGLTNPWTLDSDLTLGQTNPWFRQVVVPLDREWHVDNAGGPSDQRLLSPVFTVDGSGSMNLQFDHSWSFEAPNFDGGVVEMSVNGGAWTDIGGPAYNGTLTNYTGNLNPLRTRPAFIGTGSAHASLTQAIAPGSTVRIRFRFGSDNAAGAPGWNIDNIAFTGVVETPFSVAVGDTGCSAATTTILTSSANPSPYGSALTLTATITTGAGSPNAGTVTFFDGATNLGTSNVVNGVATLSVSNLSVGAHTLTASFSGAPGFLPGNSPSLPQTISKIATSVAVLSSASPWGTCSPVTFTATVSSVSGTPTGSVVFSEGATTLATTTLTGGVASFSTSALSLGVHTITATYGGNATFASSSNTASQTIVAAPATPTASNTGPFCENGTIQLNTPTVAGATYSWTGPGGFTSTDQNPSIANATVAMGGSYSVTVTQYGCASAAGSTTVVVNATPATPTASNDGPYCELGTISLSTPAVSGATYAWTGPDGFTSALQNPTISGATLAKAGLYSVTVTVNGCPSAAGSTTVVVNATPATPTASNSGPYCELGTIALSTPTVSGATYAWTGPDGFASALQNPTISGATLAKAGLYSVTVTVNGCPSAAGSTTVVVNAAPATPTASNSGPYCELGTIALSTPTVAGATYAWSGPDGFTSTQQNPTISGATLAKAGVYSVTVTVNGCPSLAGSTTVVVNATPATPTVTPLSSTTLCPAGSVILQSSSATGNQWYLNGNPILSATNQQYTATGAGDYTVIVTTNGCSSNASSAVTVSTVANPSATISVTSSVTTGTTGNSASVPNAGVAATYTWQITGGTITAGDGTASITFTAGAVGTLTLQVSVQNGTGCSASGNANVAVTAVPPVVTITSVTPNSISWAGGAALTITGTGFASGASVTIGGVPATSVVVVNATQITCTAPAHAAGTVNVTVTNADTTTATMNNAVTYTQMFDANGDNTIDPSDIFYLVAYLFTGGPAPSGPAGTLSGDANGDGVVDPSDIFYLVNFLYGTGPAPAAKTPGVRSDAAGAGLSGTLSFGTPQHRSGRTIVPVLLQLDPGSVAPQALALRVVSDAEVTLSARRAGVTAALTPVFEISRADRGSVAQLLVLDTAMLLPQDGSAVVIGEIEWTAGRPTRLEFDPASTLLSNGGGTRSARAASGTLRLQGLAVPAIDREIENTTRGGKQ